MLTGLTVQSLAQRTWGQQSLPVIFLVIRVYPMTSWQVWRKLQENLADPLPFKAIEVLTKKVKSQDMKGRPILSAQLQF